MPSIVRFDVMIHCAPCHDWGTEETKKQEINKASANKIKILIFFIQTPQHITYFGRTFAVEFFSGVYHTQDTRDEKGSLVLPHGEHGEIEPLDPSGIPLNPWEFHGNSMENPWEIRGPVTDS